MSVVKRSKPQMGICRKCRGVRVLVAGLCRDCRDAAAEPAHTSTPPPTTPGGGTEESSEASRGPTDGETT